MTEKKKVVKKKKKTKTSPLLILRRFDRIVDLLEEINNKITSRSLASYNLEQTFSNDVPEDLPEDVPEDVPVKDVILITKDNEHKIIDYEFVKAEAKELCKIDTTNKVGYKKAQEIIKEFGVNRIKDLPESLYPDLVTKIRKSIHYLKETHGYN